MQGWIIPRRWFKVRHIFINGCHGDIIMHWLYRNRQAGLIFPDEQINHCSNRNCTRMQLRPSQRTDKFRHGEIRNLPPKVHQSKSIVILDWFFLGRPNMSTPHEQPSHEGLELCLGIKCDRQTSNGEQSFFQCRENPCHLQWRGHLTCSSQSESWVGSKVNDRVEPTQHHHFIGMGMANNARSRIS